MSEYKLKKLRLRNPDGSLSEMYDIGADAANIDVENKMTLDVKLNNIDVKINANKEAAGAASKMAGENKTNIDNMSEQVAAAQKDITDLDAIVKTKPYVFNTVADMKKCLTLKDGDACETLGYYEVNDGGSATYKITNIKSDTEYQENINNGLFADIIKNNIKIYNVKQYGVKAEVNESQNDKIDLIISKMKNGDLLYFPKGQYYFNKQIILKHRIGLIGDDFSTGDRDKTYSGSRLFFDITEEITSSSYYLINCTENNKTLIKNIYVISNSFEITCDRSKQSINATPVDCFIETTKIKNIIGIKLFDYGSTLQNVVVRGCSKIGVLGGFYNLLENVRVYSSLIAFSLYNDNTINNCNCFTCHTGMALNGGLNLINNFRADEIKTYGMTFNNSSSNNINNITIDYAQNGAIKMESNSNNNYITGNIGRVGTYYAENGNNSPSESCYISLSNSKNNRIDIITIERKTTDDENIINNPVNTIVVKNNVENNNFTFTGNPKGLKNIIAEPLTLSNIKKLYLIEYGYSNDIIKFNGMTYIFKNLGNDYNLNNIITNQTCDLSNGFMKYKFLSSDSNEISFNFNRTITSNWIFRLTFVKNNEPKVGMFLVGYANYSHIVSKINDIAGCEVLLTATDNPNIKKITLTGLTNNSKCLVESNYEIE